MSTTRQSCLTSLKEISGVEVKLVTKQEIKDWILPDHPLHPAFEYLSEVHKADYLRTYFMNFYGGGYSDIKKPSTDWNKYFDEMDKNPEIWMCGYGEQSPHDIAFQPLANHWNELVGNGCYISRKQTPLTKEWYSEMIRLLDSKLEDLIKNPSRNPYDSKE